MEGKTKAVGNVVIAGVVARKQVTLAMEKAGFSGNIHLNVFTRLAV